MPFNAISDCFMTAALMVLLITMLMVLAPLVILLVLFCGLVMCVDYLVGAE